MNRSAQQCQSVPAGHNDDLPRIARRDEWLVAREELLAQEKQFNRQRDALSLQRRKLPMVKVEKEYAFDGPDGRVSLSDLFGKHHQLIVYHFMFDPEWNDGCKSCSHFMDNAAGSIAHLAARDTAFVVISRAPLSKIGPFKKRMGWTFLWLSSFATDFNYDFHVTLDKDVGSIEYNYANAADLVKAQKLWSDKGELPGLSVFVRRGDEVFHTYTTYQRGLDLPLNTYNFLDMTPLGRQEENIGAQSWIRHRDKYPVLGESLSRPSKHEAPSVKVCKWKAKLNGSVTPKVRGSSAARVDPTCLSTILESSRMVTERYRKGSGLRSRLCKGRRDRKQQM